MQYATNSSVAATLATNFHTASGGFALWQ